MHLTSRFHKSSMLTFVLITKYNNLVYGIEDLATYNIFILYTYTIQINHGITYINSPLLIIETNFPPFSAIYSNQNGDIS